MTAPPGYANWGDFESDMEARYKQANALYEQGKTWQAGQIELIADRMLSRYNAAVKRGDVE